MITIQILRLCDRIYRNNENTKEMGYPVYLNGHFPSAAETAAAKDTLTILVTELRKSGKTDAQIYSVLLGMGIDPEKAANGIQGISKIPTSTEVAMQKAAQTFLQVISVEENNSQTKNTNMKFSVENLVKKIQETKQSIGELDAANAGKYGFSVKKINEALDASLVALDMEKAHGLLKSIDNTNKSLEDAHMNKSDAQAELEKLKKQAMAVTERKNYLEAISVLRQKLHEHAWIESVKDLCLHIDEAKAQNRLSLFLMEALYNMKSDRFAAFNSKPVEAIEKMIEEGEDFIKENYSSLKTFAWSVPVRNAASKIASTLNEMKDTSAAMMQKIYSPVQENEDGTITIALAGKFYAISENEIVEAAENQKPGSRFLKTLDALSIFSATNEGFTYYGKRKSLTINEKGVSVENRPLENLAPEAIMTALQESALTSNDSRIIAEKIAFLIESIDTVKEIDIFTSVASTQRRGVAVNIAKINESIFINRINSAMGCNEMIQVNSAKVAQELVNEFINFDITPLVQEMLSVEEKLAFDLQNQKNTLQENIKTLEDKKKEVISTMALHPENEQLKEAVNLLNSEIESKEKELQSVYHKISEISEKKS
jgi:hypothetical protein